MCSVCPGITVELINKRKVKFLISTLIIPFVGELFFWMKLFFSQNGWHFIDGLVVRNLFFFLSFFTVTPYYIMYTLLLFFVRSLNRKLL